MKIGLCVVLSFKTIQRLEEPIDYWDLSVLKLFVFIVGLIVGAIIRYAGSTNQITHIDAHPAPDTKYNLSVPPDVLRFHFPDTIPISPGGKC